ncbi:hypothetical protein [Sphingomonas sp.]|uniref:hypothetical protein n=1 Tax=Sphingomonas sp. TaxID=28214 RepID=UPI003D6CE76A
MPSSTARAIGFAMMAALAVAAAPVRAQDDGGRALMRELGMGGLDGKKLKKAIEKADAKSLGSKDNPIRVNMPVGEHAYLARLRCADGTAPAEERAGSVGIGVFGNILDLYKVTCAGQPAVDVYMDMYHEGPENRPVPGFTIVE